VLNRCALISNLISNAHHHADAVIARRELGA
jgi:hypothetical protein